MAKEPYVQVFDHVPQITDLPVGVPVNIVVVQKAGQITTTVTEVDYTEGRTRKHPCGSQGCEMELVRGIGCASACEYHKNYLKEQQNGNAGNV